MTGIQIFNIVLIFVVIAMYACKFIFSRLDKNKKGDIKKSEKKDSTK